MPKISIIMGIYNCAPYLKEAIDSILKQTFSDWELIMCDDGSDDETYNIAQSYAERDDRIVLLKNDGNMGLSVTLNRCLAVARAEIIARMDGDDISLPERLEKEFSFLEMHPEFSVVSCPMIQFDEKGIFRSGKGGYEIFAKDFPKGPPIGHAPSMFRKKAFDDVEGYTEDKKVLRVEDRDLWLKLILHRHRMYVIGECLYMVRDGNEAYHRRKYKYRANCARIIAKSIRKLKLPVYNYIYVLRPLVVGLLPKPIYDRLHKGKRDN